MNIAKFLKTTILKLLLNNQSYKTLPLVCNNETEAKSLDITLAVEQEFIEKVFFFSY